MSNHLRALLEAWQQARDDTDWVLGTVYRTEGSAYRKAGSMMLIDGYGRQFGLLSGGCLEADIVRHASRVMQTGEVAMLAYDGSDEDDWSYRLGIGCGGKVYIMLQPILPGDDLALGAIAGALDRRQGGSYHQKIGAVEAWFESRAVDRRDRSRVERRDDGDWLVTPICPEPHLLVVGGGIDARPVVDIASRLGWRVTLSDPRTTHARAADFRAADRILRKLGDDLRRYIGDEKVDATVIMSHNLDIDAEALQCCRNTGLAHIALLGPGHRYRRVLELAGLDAGSLDCPVSTPAGFDIGGQLPESIALSILAECHARLYHGEQLPLLRLASA